MNNTEQVRRYVAVFQKSDNHYLIDRFYLPDNALPVLIELFNPPSDDPLMYDYYDIDGSKAEILNVRFGIKFSLSDYDYAVGAHAA